jgi:outer membrane protein assembly factor BamB
MIRFTTPCSPTRLLAAALAVTLGTGLVGCATDALTGPADVAGESQELAAGSFTVDWQVPLDLRGSEVVGTYLLDDLIIVNTAENRSLGVAAASGTPRFSTRVVPASESMFPPVAVNAGTNVDPRPVLAYPSVASVVTLDMNGREVKKNRLPYAFSSPATAAEGRMYAGISTERGGQLAAVAPTAEARPMQWRRLLDGPVLSRPAVAAGITYVATDAGADGRGHVYAVAPNTESAWNRFGEPDFTTYGGNIADLAVDSFGLYVASLDTQLYCLDRLSGRIKWRWYAGESLRDAPVPTRERVYQYVPGRGLAAVPKQGDSDPRTEDWIAADARQFLAEGEQHVFALGASGRLLALDKEDGRVAFTSERSDFIAGTVSDNGEVFALTADGVLIKAEANLKPGRVGTPL